MVEMAIIQEILVKRQGRNCNNIRELRKISNKNTSLKIVNNNSVAIGSLSKKATDPPKSIGLEEQYDKDDSSNIFFFAHLLLSDDM